MLCQLPCDFCLIKGDQPGPNILIMGGTHGDETIGLLVIEELKKMLGLKKDFTGEITISGIKGNLYLGVGNPKAVKSKTRAAGSGADLNRSFQTCDLEKKPEIDDQPDLIRARELWPLFKQTDYLFDLHSTSSESMPFVCLGQMDHPHLIELARFFPVSNILTDPENVLSRDHQKTELGTTDYAVNIFGGSDWNKMTFQLKRGFAFCYESGWAKDLEKVKNIFQTILALLLHLNVLPEQFRKFGNVKTKNAQKQLVYALKNIVLAKKDGFVFYNDFKKGWTKVQKGQAVGEYPDGESEKAELDGLILFPKGKKFIPTRESLFYIAELLQF